MDEQGALRLGVFVAVCLGLGLWEAWWPRRSDARRRVRWPVNLSLAAVNTVVVRVLAPASGVTFALLAEGRGLGLLRAVEWPAAVEFVLAVLVLDALVYVQHRLFHALPWLWRLHRLHHADAGFDFTTGVRFHPGEIAVSTIYKGVCIVALGGSPLATLAFEIVLSTGSLFSHANARLAGDRLLAAGVRHARHAPRPPLHRRRRAECQLRLQLLVVGPARGHLPAGAAAAARDDADWDRYRSVVAPGGGSPALICSSPCRARTLPDPTVSFW